MKISRMIVNGGILLGIVLFFFISPFQVAAEENFPNGKTTKKLTESMEVNVVNEELTSKLTFITDDQIVFEKELTAISISNVEKITVAEEEYAVITYRYDGSSNALFFEVLKISQEGVTSIYISDTFPRAQFQLVGDEIVVKYPEYDANQIRTEPSKLVTQTFLLSEKSVKEGIKEVEEQDHSPKANISGVNNYQEVSRILTEEAIAAKVSPEIVKAIAFQESGWQQYWDTVPESIKKCPNYDGTNVKLGYDCIGIGIMQISDYRSMEDGPEKDAYIHKLKTNIRFNVQEGIKILKEKWNWGGKLIPTVNDNDAMALENWYFAILAYNGLLERNDPIKNAYSAYQEDVFQKIEQYSLLDLTPFPTQKLIPNYETVKGQLRFDNTNVTVEGPLTYSSLALKAGDYAYVTENGVNLRKTAGGAIDSSVNKGDRVTITGDFVGHTSRFSHYAWVPVRTSSGQNGFIASSYLKATIYDYIDTYPLFGNLRYDTAVSVSNYGWHWNKPNSVIIAQGLLPVDALTGSVLASSLGAPILLNQSDSLTDSTAKELSRLKPKTIYILGGENAISEEVVTQLDELYGTVIRISGKDRYQTAKVVADKVMNDSTTKEIFITTGDETSSDPLAIAPYAGAKGIPILLSASNKLSKPVKAFIQENNINKVTIIGGTGAISNNVALDLNALVGSSNVERVFGTNRFATNIEIIKKYYKETTEKNKVVFNNLVVAQGMNTADALAAAPFATRINAPIILTLPNVIPTETRNYLGNQVVLKPDLYFLGGQAAIQDSVREQVKLLVK